MKYLLDVVTLVALGFEDHVFHEAVARWVRSLPADDRLLTSPITELGFVRVLAQAPQYGLRVEEAKTLLVRLRAEGRERFEFLADGHSVAHLPKWVNSAKQITDGHLSRLAKENGAILATLDRKIPGAFLVPQP